jgi:site-specific DNA recombinase
MKYFIYCRKSSEEENKQVQSLETQQKNLLEYATKNNLEVVEIIRESRSAKTDGNRPLFSSMLERISNKEATGILVLHTDRLSRNGIESGKIVKLFEEGFLQEIRTPNKIYNSISDMLYIDFDFVFAAHYSRNLSIRVKEGNKTKLEKGEYPGMAPLGYINKNAKIYPDPTRAKYIQKAFKLYNQGEHSLIEIAEILYKEGLRTRRAHKKNHRSLIQRALRSPFYYGVISRNGALYKGVHKPLISKSLFDRVNDRLNGKNRSKHYTHRFLYRPFLSCAVCNCQLTASIKKGKYNYYYCTNGKKKCLEHKKYLTEKDIETLVKKHLIKFTLNKELADLSLSLYIEDYKKQFTDKVSTREVIQKQINTIKKKLDNLLNLRLEESIDETTYKEKQKALKNELVEMEVSLSQVKEENLDRTLELLYEIKNRACSLSEMFECKDYQVRSDLLNSVLWNFGIKEQKIATVEYKLPYAYFKDLNKTRDISVWRRRQDSNLREGFYTLGDLANHSNGPLWDSSK